MEHGGASTGCRYFWTYILMGSVALATLIAVGDGRLRGQSLIADT